MTGFSQNRSIRIEENAIGNVIVSGDKNTILVVHQTLELSYDENQVASEISFPSNPYRGLSAFRERDAARYFGREKEVKRLWEKFKELLHQSEYPRILPIIGPSGCGKSSLVRAGLIPELIRRPILEQTEAQVALMAPGASPLEGLAGVLAKLVTGDLLPVEKTKEFETVLSLKNSFGEYDGLRRIVNLIPNASEKPLIIVVDQFEEVFSVCKNLEQREAFIENLLLASVSSTTQLSVLFTLRSDFWSETQRYEVLNQIIGSEQSVNIPAMTAVELQRAIAEPARQSGHPLDENTIERLVIDTKGREGALPLLQFTLTRIWEGLGSGKTPSATYDEINGLGGALAGKAQEIYEKLSINEKEIAKRIFLNLVEVVEGNRDTRRRVPIQDLVSSHNSFELVKQVIRYFASPEIRLITLSRQKGVESAEVTHEALFEHWKELKRWLDSSRENLLFRRRLEAAARNWKENGKSDGLLWRSPDSTLVKEYKQEFSRNAKLVEIEFLEASTLVARRSERRQRLLVSGLGVGFALSALFLCIAFLNMRKANQNSTRAELSSIKTLAQYSATLNASGKSFDAIIVALRARKRLQEEKISDDATINLVRGSLLASLLSYGHGLYRIDGHERDVLDVSFSPDGKIIATASEDYTAKLWKADGTLLSTLDGHQGPVWMTQFSPDGKTIVTASSDGSAKIWQADGALLTTIEDHEEWIEDIQFSPDSSSIAIASSDGTADLRSLDGTLLSILKGHPSEVNSIRFSSDGTMIATASSDIARIWKLDGTLLKALEGHEATVEAIVFSPNDQHIVTTSVDGDMKIWKTSTAESVDLKNHNNRVEAIQFSSDSRFFAAASEGSDVKLWRSDGTLVAELDNYRNRVQDISFNQNSNTFITASRNGEIRSWDLDGTLVATVKPPPGSASRVVVDSDGSMAASISESIVSVWEIDSAFSTILEDHTEEIIGIQFSPSEELIATASRDNTAKLWNFEGELISTLVVHNYEVRDIQFSPNGKIIATASADGSVGLWSSDGVLLTTLEGHKGTVESIQFSSDGKTIATASWDNTAKLWHSDGRFITTLRDGNDFEVITTFVSNADYIWDVRFSPDNKVVAVVNDDYTVKLWSREGKLITELAGHSDDIWDVEFSPDGSFIATASHDGKLKLWNLDGSVIKTIVTGQKSVKDVHFSPDGSFIVTAGTDGTAKIWSTDGSLMASLEGHNGIVWNALFSPDGNTVATAGEDGTVKLWLTDGALITTLDNHSASVRHVRFSPDGNTIATADEDSTAQLWQWGVDSLVFRICNQIEGYLQSSPNIALEDKLLCE